MSSRVLFYVQHLLGVGHVMRAAAIARALADQGADVCVAFGGEEVSVVDFGRANVHQLPSARTADKSFKIILDEAGNGIDEAWRERRRQALIDLAATFRPDVLLVEHFPFGRRKFAFELVPLFEFIKSQGDVPILCSVRDVLTDIREPHIRQKIADLAQNWCDRVLVHGDPSVIRFETTFREAEGFADRITYTGYVVDERPLNDDAPGDDGHDEIIVSVGGGAFGEALLTAAIEASQSGALASRQWRLLAGDKMREEVFEHFHAQATDRVKVERARPDFRELLSRAALSISQGGYNTLMNVLLSGRPGLVVPFEAPGQGEQILRARQFANRGLLHLLEEHDLSGPALARAAETALAMRPAGETDIDLAGADSTARIVMQFAQRDAAKAS
jgi:predicted glycosyltransferase